MKHRRETPLEREGAERDVLKAALDWHAAVETVGSDRMVPKEEAALYEAARKLGLMEALAISVVAAGLLNNPLPSMKPYEVKEARDNMLSGIHKINDAIRKRIEG